MAKLPELALHNLTNLLEENLEAKESPVGNLTLREPFINSRNKMD